MRELNLTEIDSVSGAGFFSDFGSQLGASIGNVVDWASTALNGKAPNASALTPATTLGTGIGQIVDTVFSGGLSGVPQAVETMGKGIAAIIAAAKANKA